MSCSRSGNRACSGPRRQIETRWRKYSSRRAAEFADGERRIIAQNGLEIGLFRWQDAFFAYENLCVHQRGPACEGLIMTD